MLNISDERQKLRESREGKNDFLCMLTVVCDFWWYFSNLLWFAAESLYFLND